MTDATATTSLLSLAQSPDPLTLTIQLSVETCHGLVFEFTTGEGLIVRLKDNIETADCQETQPETSSPAGEATAPVILTDTVPRSQAETQLKNLNQNRQFDPKAARPDSKVGYRYAIDPDFGTSCLWYHAQWPENPDQFHIKLEDLRGPYVALWLDAFKDWEKRYSKSFKAQECELGSGNEVFSDVQEHMNWHFGVVFLGCWLALQDGGDRVTFQPDETEFVF